jgi:dipeptidyl aminopeptidase/acylaminoacyl peptidase
VPGRTVVPVPVPLELVMSGRDLTEPRLSPDGESVAFVHRWGTATGISIVDAEGRGPERLVTFGPEPAAGRGAGGGCFTWLPNSTGIVYVARDGELWLVDGIELRRLTAHRRSCRAPAVDRDGSHVVVAVDELEIWLTDLHTGSSRRLDDGRHEFCFDPVFSPDGDTVSWQGWSPPAMPWDASERIDLRVGAGGWFDDVRITSWRPVDGAVQQPRFSTDGSPSCVHDGAGWLNVHRSGHVVLDEPAEHASPSWSMGQRSYAFDDTGGCFIARSVGGFGSLVRVDRSGEVTRLAPDFTGVYGQLSAVGDRLCAVRSGPTTPAEIVVVDVAGNDTDVRVVATSGAIGWSDVGLTHPEAVHVDHDGITLHARRYAAGPDGDARGLLCWVHGGPTDQWQVDFRPRIAYWCSRGWEVLVVDPRGSTGHGRAYQQALVGGWGRTDVDDTAALIGHVHGAGRATPESTVVIGGSSGGLTVLGLLADHPHLVAGGIASYPVSDLGALSQATHRFEAHYTDTLVGSAGDLEALSPIHRAGRIAGPLLLFHGSDDEVVPIAQSDALVDRIRAGGGTVDYVVYAGEGHGFREPDNVRDEYARTELFLDRIAAAAGDGTSAAISAAISEPM